MSTGCENCVIRLCEAANPGELPVSVMNVLIGAQPTDNENPSSEEEEKMQDALDTRICEVDGCEVTLGSLMRWIIPDVEAPDSVSRLGAREAALHELEAAAGRADCAIFETQNQRW